MTTDDELFLMEHERLGQENDMLKEQLDKLSRENEILKDKINELQDYNEYIIDLFRRMFIRKVGVEVVRQDSEEENS